MKGTDEEWRVERDSLSYFRSAFLLDMELSGALSKFMRMLERLRDALSLTKERPQCSMRVYLKNNGVD